MTPERRMIEPTYRGGGGVQGWLPACPSKLRNGWIVDFLEWMVSMNQVHYDWRDVFYGRKERI